MKLGLKQTILDTVSDLVADFLYYGRKEDEELGVGDIEFSIKNGEITINEIIECFKNELISKLEDK